MSDSAGARTPTTMSDHARWSVILGLPFLMLAAYFYLTPISLAQGGEGGLFYCGSAASPNDESAKVCQDPETSNRYKAAAALGAGAGVPALGLVLFGAGRRDHSSRDVDLRDDLDEDELDEGEVLHRGDRDVRRERRVRPSPFDDGRGRRTRRDEPARDRRHPDDDWDR